MAVFSDGSYNTPKGVMFSFPVRCSAGKWEIVQVLIFPSTSLQKYIKHILWLFKGLTIDEFAAGKLEVTGKELMEEREEALDVCQDGAARL